MPAKPFDLLADQPSVAKTIAALEQNGIRGLVVDSGAAAKEKVLALLPAGAEVLTMTSMTLEAIGLARDIDESGTYDAVRPKLMRMDWKTQASEMRKLAAAPDYVAGSAHAVTEDGHVLIASNTGSQLATYVYTAGKVLWVVGTQKIVADDAEGMRRIHEYCFPLEDQRAQKAYGVGSGVNKVLVVHKEVQPGRITIVFVKESLGF